MTGIRTNVPYAQYDAIDALNISKLKNMAKSPKHFQYFKDHPQTSKPMTLGTAAHCAVLEPERFKTDYAVWYRMSENGNQAPRRGQHWDAFLDANAGKSIITVAEMESAKAIARAIRSEPAAMRYLASGQAEVVLEWTTHLELSGIADMGIQSCKGRIDWLTHIEDRPYLVGLKTARDIRNIQFGNQSARLLYACQWAWYAWGYFEITGVFPELREIVVESSVPHDVVVYEIPEDIIDYGRDEYQRLLKLYARCVGTDEWPGIGEGREQLLSFPSWAFQSGGDDLSDLDLETEE